MRKITFLSLIILILVCLGFQDTLAQLPKTINYQAKLVDDANQPLNRNVTITFSIYDQEVGGNPLWVEPQDVIAVNGYVNVYLGEFNPMNLDFSKQYWLEIQVGAGNPYSPRTKLSTSPYSISSSFANESGIANSVANQSITLNSLAPEVLAAGGDLEGTFPNPRIKSSAIAEKIANGSISIEMLAPEVREYLSPLGGDLTGVPSNARIKAGAVRTVNLQDGSVTSDKIANASIGLSHLSPGLTGSFINSASTVGSESDLTGTFATLKVAKINGVPINTTVPLNNGAVYMYDNVNGTWVPAIAGGALVGPYSNLSFNTSGASDGDVLKYDSVTGKATWSADPGVVLPFSASSTANVDAFQITQANINGDAATTAIKGENLDAQGQAAHFTNSNPNSVKPAVTMTNASGLHSGTAFEAYKDVVQSDLSLEPRQPHYVGKIYDTDQTTPGGRGLYIESNTPRTSDPGVVGGIPYHNWSSLNNDPMDKDEATLVVRNRSTDDKKIAIKTYGDIVANSWLYASDGLVLGTGTYSTQLTPPDATVDALKLTGNLKLIDGTGNVAGTIQAGSFAGDGSEITGILPSNIAQAGAALNEVLTWDGTEWVPGPSSGSVTETDPVFTESPAGGITATQISNWDSAFGWGDHSSAGYLTSSAFNSSPAGGITATQISNWDSAFGWGDHSSAGYLTSSAFNSSPAGGITATQISNWDNAYSWGDHSTEGYMKAADFNSTPAAGITSAQVTNWNNAFGWGDHSTEGYLKNINNESINDLSDVNTTGVVNGQVLGWDGTAWVPQNATMTEADPVFVSWLNDNANVDEWDAAFGWGDHSTEGYMKTADFNSSPAGGITSAQIMNWNTAFGWGDHSTEGYMKSADFNSSPAAGITATEITNWNNAYSWGDHSTAGYINLPFAQSYDESSALFSLTNSGNGAVAIFNGNSLTNPTLTAQNPNGLALQVNGVFHVAGDAGFENDVFITNDLYTGDAYTNNIISSGYIQSVGDIGVGADLFVTNDVYANDINANDIYAANFYGNVDLSNLNDGGAATGQVLGWDGAAWVPQNATMTEADPIFDNWLNNTANVANWNTAFGWGDHSTEGYLKNINSESINDLNDVNTAGAAAGQVLGWDGTAWVPQNATMTEADPIFDNWLNNTANVANWNTAYGWGDHSTEGYMKTADFNTTPAAGITATEVTNWNNAYSWGDHSTEGYMKSADFNTTPAAGITATDLTNWNNAYGWGDHSTEGYMKSADFNTTPAAGITATDLTNWNNAYGWGDHSTEGYLKNINNESINDLNDVNTAGVATGQVLGWDGAAWVPQNATMTEADPIFDNWLNNTANVANWNSAYGWGDHSTEGYLKLPYSGSFADETVLNLTNNSAVNSTLVVSNPNGWALEVNGIMQANDDVGISGDLFVFGTTGIVASGDVIATNFYGNVGLDNLDQGGAATGQVLGWDGAAWVPQNATMTEADPIFDNWLNNTANVANWNNAYSWGDHSTEGYMKSADFNTTPAAGITATDVANWDTAFGWGDHSTEGYLKNINNESINDLNDVNTAGAATGQVLGWDGAAWVPQNATMTEADPIFDTWLNNTANVADWNTAYGWGDHSTAGYLTLPIDESLNSAAAIVDLTNTGTGAVMSLTNNSNLNSALIVTNTSGGNALDVTGNVVVHGEGGFNGLSVDGLTIFDNLGSDALIVTSGASTFADDVYMLSELNGLGTAVIKDFDEIEANTITATTFVGSINLAQNLAGGTVGAIAYQTAANETGFVAPAAGVGQILTSALDINGNFVPAWDTQVIDAVNIFDGAITESKIEDGAVSNSKIAQMGANDGEALIWSDANSQWQPQDITVTELDPIFDAWYNDADPNSDVANWNTAFNWVNANSANVLLNTSSIGDLADVDLATNPPVIDDVLSFDGTNWIPTAINLTTTLQEAYEGGNEIEVDNNLPVTFTAAAGYNGQRIMSIYNEGNVQGLSIETNNDQNEEATLFVSSNAGSGANNWGSVAIFENTNPANKDYAVGISTASNQTDAVALQVAAGGNVSRALNVSGNSVLTSYDNTNAAALLEVYQEGTGPGVVVNSPNANNVDIALAISSNAGSGAGNLGSAATFAITNPANKDYAVGVSTASDQIDAVALQVAAGGNVSRALNVSGNSVLTSYDNTNASALLDVYQEGTGPGVVVNSPNANNVDIALAVSSNAGSGAGNLGSAATFAITNTANKDYAVGISTVSDHPDARALEVIAGGNNSRAINVSGNSEFSSIDASNSGNVLAVLQEGTGSALVVNIDNAASIEAAVIVATNADEGAGILVNNTSNENTAVGLQINQGKMVLSTETVPANIGVHTSLADKGCYSIVKITGSGLTTIDIADLPTQAVNGQLFCVINSTDNDIISDSGLPLVPFIAQNGAAMFVYFEGAGWVRFK